MSKYTKKLTQSQYGGIPLSFPDYIQKHVNKEENLWYENEIPPTPAYRVTKIKRSAGVFNFIRNSVLEVRP